MQDKTICIVTPIVTEAFRSPQALSDLSGPGFTVTNVQIERGPASIECEMDIVLAAPDTVAAMVRAQEQGADAIIVDCMGDPGLRAGREMCSVPVFGPCETSLHVASILCHRFTYLTILERLIPSIADNVAKYGCRDRLASIRSVEIPVLDIDKDLDAAVDALTREALAAVREDGADGFVFGCTGLLGCGQAVRERLLAQGMDVPVIDPIPTTVNFAAAMLRAGHMHSKRSWPRPDAKRVDGFPQPELILN